MLFHRAARCFICIRGTSSKALMNKLAAQSRPRLVRSRAPPITLRRRLSRSTICPTVRPSVCLSACLSACLTTAAEREWNCARASRRATGSVALRDARAASLRPRPSGAFASRPEPLCCAWLLFARSPQAQLGERRVHVGVARSPELTCLRLCSPASSRRAGCPSNRRVRGAARRPTADCRLRALLER